eukprot:1014659-Prorocentrum_lima.AAC.1
MASECANETNQGPINQDRFGPMVGSILLQIGDGHGTWLCNGTKSDHASAHRCNREGSFRRSPPYTNMVGQSVRTISETPTTHDGCDD